MDRQIAEHVVAVGLPGGGHRVGDQDHAVAVALDGLGHQVELDVHTVHDQLQPDALVSGQPEDRPGVPVVQRGHRVEQVGGAGGACVDRGLCGGQVGVGVPDRGNHAVLGQQPDGLDAVIQFRGQRDHLHRAAPSIGQGGGVQQPDDIGRLWGAQHLQRMRTLLARRQPRPLQVDARQLAGRHQRGQHAQLPLQFVQRLADQGGDHRRRAVRAVQCQRRRGIESERGPAAAVAVHVDQPGGDELVAEIDHFGRTCSGRVRAVVQLDDQTVGDLDAARPAVGDAVEDPAADEAWWVVHWFSLVGARLATVSRMVSRGS